MLSFSPSGFGFAIWVCTPVLPFFVPVLTSVDIRQKRQYYFTPESLWASIVGATKDLSTHQNSLRRLFMTIKEKMQGDVAVLTFKGNLMGEPDTTEVRDKIYGLLQEGFNKIVLDMGQVKWVNSSGLGTLIAAMTSVKNKGGEMRLARVTDKVESLFAITQLIKVFKTYETVERAVASFK